MRDTLRKMRCATIEEITALISLYRPGPMDNIDTFVDGKFGRKPIDTLHPSLTEVLAETYGVIVYQEQVMQIAQILAGYSLGEADLLRRAMGKKKKEEMDAQKARFVSGAAEKGVLSERSAYIFDLVAKFAGYGFNKSHAAAYAIISYQTGWLKANHPVEFVAASMSLDLSNTDKLAVFYQDAKRLGVTVRPPDVNRSRADFDVADGEILYALGAVRNVGLSAMEHLVAVRETGGAFRDLFDFLERVDPKCLNKRALENLARAGAFDSLHPNRAQIVACADALIAYMQSVAEERVSAQVSLFGGTDLTAGRPRLARTEPWTGPQTLDEELAAVGFYLSGHPLQDMAEALRRRKVVLYSDALALAEEGHEAFRMGGVVRRRQERAGASGDKFAFVTLSDPSGEYEVLFPPESLRNCRDCLEPGKAVVIKVRCKSRDGEVRFFGDEAAPIDTAVVDAVGALRVWLQPQAADLDAIRKRLGHAPRGAGGGGGEIVLTAGLGGGAEIELKLPGRYVLDSALRGALKTAPGVLHLEDV